MEANALIATPAERPGIAPATAAITLDGNEAVARVAYQLSEVVALYPITPASPMGEWVDTWVSQQRPNLWGSVPRVVEMQSEGGAAGALSGAVQAGSLATSFTASQGLLLMIPDMYKMAGALSPVVLHVAARSVATHGLSIFGDHSDVMAARQTGWALLASASVQEAMDMALIAHAAALESRLPFLHFFDGFRTSHEVNKIIPVTPDQIRALVDDEAVAVLRRRALSPEHAFIRGTSHNPDTFFQAREASNPFYRACPRVVRNLLLKFELLTGRRYGLFDYSGAPDAETVLVLMGSGAETAAETVEKLARDGIRAGVLRVRLYRPFDLDAFWEAMPHSVRTLVVLDRTKEPGSLGEPLYQDVATAVLEAPEDNFIHGRPRVLGGRYGLSSKEFTPAMVKAVIEEASSAAPRNHFTIGIHDDVTHTSLDWDASFTTEEPETFRALFYGIGSDGTVGANKNTIKIIGEGTGNYAQGYFVYDSRKSGSMTTSHLRFGPHPIRSAYLIREAQFVACHQFGLLDRVDVLAAAGGVFLLNSPWNAETVWGHLPLRVRQSIRAKKLRFFVIDASGLARDLGMGNRVNTILQTCFFAISGVLEQEQALEAIRKSIRKSYGKRGEETVEQNLAAVDRALSALHEVTIPAATGDELEAPEPAANGAARARDFIHRTILPLIAGRGDELPVSAFPVDGTYPSGTTRLEKRNLADSIPVWNEELCIQCGKCVVVCPHAAIRAKVYPANLVQSAPPVFGSTPARWREFGDDLYTLQVAPEDCTGCSLCVHVCPAVSKQDGTTRALEMQPQPPLREQEKRNWEFFLSLPDTPREQLHLTQVKDIQLLPPLFEFSGACAGCGETPYLKLLSQLFGDHLMVANATGCSSIYGGNLPATPWATDAHGRGPAWCNSLFEDNAEFGLGMRVAVDHQHNEARRLVEQLRERLPAELATGLLEDTATSDEAIARQRDRVAVLKRYLAKLPPSPEAQALAGLAEALIPRSVWIVGGDGWAYDIGYGGLDHVLSSSSNNVNVLVMDTEVYSNTGGQMSKATPRGAMARFAAAGKREAKKDLALMALSYGHVYVARVALGASDSQTLRAFREAEAWPGPSLILAYGACIAHGYDLCDSLQHQKVAVASGYWPLFRYNPGTETSPLQLDSREPSIPASDFLKLETRFAGLASQNPEAADELARQEQEDIQRRWTLYQRLAEDFKNPATHVHAH